MPHIDDYVTYIEREEDRPYLRTNLLPVSMRLWHANDAYRELVQHCCLYLRKMALMKLEGYPQPFGMSGANLAIPFNIIGVVHNRRDLGTNQKPWCEILMNPVITEYRGPVVYASSNCGSIRLAKPIEVLRYDSVKVHYFNIRGHEKHRRFGRHEGSFTIQHEVDHNRGLLITDQSRLLPNER